MLGAFRGQEILGAILLAVFLYSFPVSGLKHALQSLRN